LKERVLIPLQISGLLRAAVAMAVVLGAAGVAALVVSGNAGPAEANGASTILYDRTQGSYRLVVGIIPARPVVPQTHLSMQVFDASDQRLLRDTDVELFVSTTGPPGSPGFGPRQVVNDASIVYFELDVPFDATGFWQLEVEVASETGAEIFLIPIEVGEARTSIQWVWVSAVLIIIALVGVWTWLTVSRRARGQQ
jgi:hypothetical protein